MNSHPDIGYRIYQSGSPTKTQWCANKCVFTPWRAWYSSVGGDRGVFTSIDSAKKAAAQRGFKQPYEIWKFHIGGPDTYIPYFPPEKVYEYVI